jgi:hypothetical protein
MKNPLQSESLSFKTAPEQDNLSEVENFSQREGERK